MKSRGLIAPDYRCSAYSLDRTKHKEVHPCPYFLYTLLAPVFCLSRIILKIFTLFT